MEYDYIIVGVGPTVLALAQMLSSFKRVLLLEKRDYLGGCHGVTRVHDGSYSFTSMESSVVIGQRASVGTG